MELIDRYLQAVKFWLPKSQQDDIIAELSEDIRSQLEDRKAELGRELDDAELESILKRRGHPILVAARYLPQQHLIGPVFFPIYWFVLKMALLCYLVPWLLVWIFIAALSPAYRAAHPGFALAGTLWGSLWLTAAFLFSGVTVTFAIIERQLANSRFLENWNPRKLPALRVVRGNHLIPRCSSIVELVFAPVIIGFWVSNPGGFPVVWGTELERTGFMAAWGPVWQDFHHSFYLPILLLLLVGVAVSGVNLFRPYWTRPRLGIRAAINCTLAAMVFLTLNAHWVELNALWVRMTAPNPTVSGAESVANWTNIGVSIGMLSVGIICFLQGLYEVIRIIRLKTPRGGITGCLTAVAVMTTIGTLAAGACPQASMGSPTTPFAFDVAHSIVQSVTESWSLTNTRLPETTG